MVPREQHRSLLSDLEALQSEREAALKQVADLESKMHQACEDLKNTTAEMEALREAQSRMAPRSELEAALTQCETLRAKLMEAEQNLAMAMEEQQKREAALETEKAQLRCAMEVSFV